MLKRKIAFILVFCCFILCIIISGCNILQDNSKSSSSSANNSGDTTPPDIAILTPTAGTIYNGQVLISGNASDASGIKQVWVKVGTNNYLSATGKENWNYIYYGGQVIDGEVISINVKAFDNAGNSRDTGITLYFSTTNSITLTNYVLQTNNTLVTNYINATNSIYITNVSTNIFNVTNMSYNFSELMDEAIDNPGLNFTYGGTELWTLDSAVFHYGGNSAKSGLIGNSLSTYIQTVITNNFISFYWKVSSQSGSDFLSCYVDGNLKASISGEVDWNYTNFAFLPGTHTVKWMYSKDGSGSSGSDCGWIDYVVVNNYIDTTPPNLNVSFPTNNYQTYTNFKATGTASDISGITGVYLSIDGGMFGSVNGTSSWNSNLLLTAGIHTIFVYAMDMFSNCSVTNSISITKLIDTTPPSINIIFPTNNYKTYGIITVNGTANDNAGLSGIYLGVDGGAFGLVQGTTNWITNLLLSGGAHTIKVYAMDMFSNNSITNSITVTKQSISGNIVYVSTSGSDDNDGSIAQPFKTIQLAIDAIKGSAATNVYVQTGVYILGSGLSSNSNSGVYIDSNNINLSGGWDSGFSSQTGFSELNGGGTINHVIFAENVSNLLINGFIIQNGNGSSGYGGGIYFNNVYNSLITNSIITNNTASYNSTMGGAGLSISGNNNKISAIVCNNISSVDFGGGIYISGKSNYINCIVYGNSGGQWGGGININNGSYNTILGTISNNSSTMYGGGIAIYNGYFNNIVGASVVNNSANHHSGGLEIRLGSNTIITNTLIANNVRQGIDSDEGGGGIKLDDTENALLIDSVIIGNSSLNTSFGGGAIAVESSINVSILNCSITSNWSSPSNSVIYLRGYEHQLTGLIISNNLIGSIPGSTGIAINELNNDTTGQIIMNNTFITNIIGYLYYDYNGVNIITNDDSWTNINETNFTGSATAGNNTVINQ